MAKTGEPFFATVLSTIHRRLLVRFRLRVACFSVAGELASFRGRLRSLLGTPVGAAQRSLSVRRDAPAMCAITPSNTWRLRSSVLKPS